MNANTSASADEIGAIHHKAGIAFVAAAAVSAVPSCARAVAAKTKIVAKNPVFTIVFFTSKLLIKKTIGFVRAKLGTVYKKRTFLQANKGGKIQKLVYFLYQ